MLLAVDTSTAQVGLALFDGSQLLGEMIWTSGQHHTVELAPALAGLLARSGNPIDRVSALGIAIGPGSFTSLRVGLAFVKGLALARSLPIVGIPTLDIIAAAQPVDKKPLAAAIQAGRARIALGWYKSSRNGWQAKGPTRTATVDELIGEIKSPTLVAGEFTSDERERLKKKKNIRLASAVNCVRRPALLAELAWARIQQKDFDAAASLAPIYLHVAGGPPA
jgi:tRNA threonylcarbamoyladenosine biosynthesis protein TsaB